MPRPSSKSAWHIGALVTCLFLAILLFTSWLLPPFDARWEALDDVVFRAVNPRLVEHTFGNFVAFTNWRPFDLVSGMCIIVMMCVWLRTDRRIPVESRLAQFSVFCGLLVFTKLCERALIKLAGFNRLSPTLVYPDAVQLTDLVHWIHTKDQGTTTFPGDHAFLVFSCVGFLWLQMGRRMGLVAALVLIPFTIPRVLIGAHWATDVLVGGLAMALMMLAIGYATPLAAALQSGLERYAASPLRFGAYIGRRLGIFRHDPA